MASATPTTRRLPESLSALLSDPCLCADTIQEPRRIRVGALSLVVCFRCEKVATKVRARVAV